MILKPIHNHYRVLKECTRVHLILKSPPGREFRKLIQLVYQHLRPHLNSIAGQYQDHNAAATDSIYKRPTKAKTPAGAKAQTTIQIQSKLTKQGNLMVSHVSVRRCTIVTGRRWLLNPC